MPRGSPEEATRTPRGGHEGFVTRKPPPGLPGVTQKWPGAAQDRKVAQVSDLGLFFHVFAEALPNNENPWRPRGHVMGPKVGFRGGWRPVGSPEVGFRSVWRFAVCSEVGFRSVWRVAVCSEVGFRSVWRFAVCSEVGFRSVWRIAVCSEVGFRSVWRFAVCSEVCFRSV